MTDKLQNIPELIENRRWLILRKELSELEAFEAGEIIEELDDNDGIIVFRLLSRELAKETFQYLPIENQGKIIDAFAKNVNKLSNLLNDLDPDDRTAFFEELPGQMTQRLIQLLSPEERSVATQLLGYPEDSIGRIMTPEFVAVKPDYNVEETLTHIRKYGSDSETFNIIYVVDNGWKLLDELKLRDIILSEPERTISDIMDNKFISLSAFEDQETAIRVFKDSDYSVLPVTDTEGLLLGIVTIDDIMDIVEEETTEDFHKFGSFQEAIVNPLKAGVTYMYRRRIMWLSILVFMNVFSGAAIQGFGDVIESMISLMFFLPLLIGSGGNAGAQSATLMIRSLAVGDVESRDWFLLAGKEFLVSLLLGTTMAVSVGLIAVFRAPEIIWIVSSAMVLTVIAGSLIGLLLPFVFTKINIDPATASAPLVTSIADILGVIIYFSIASWYLGI
ncbi:MAG: magnesium transporter [Candidatus Delongbacteria bacterium]